MAGADRALEADVAEVASDGVAAEADEGAELVSSQSIKRHAWADIDLDDVSAGEWADFPVAHAAAEDKDGGPLPGRSRRRRARAAAAAAAAAAEKTKEAGYAAAMQQELAVTVCMDPLSSELGKWVQNQVDAEMPCIGGLAAAATLRLSTPEAPGSSVHQHTVQTASGKMRHVNIRLGIGNGNDNGKRFVVKAMSSSTIAMVKDLIRRKCGMHVHMQSLTAAAAPDIQLNDHATLDDVGIFDDSHPLLLKYNGCR